MCEVRCLGKGPKCKDLPGSWASSRLSMPDYARRLLHDDTLPHCWQNIGKTPRDESPASPIQSDLDDVAIGRSNPAGHVLDWRSSPPTVPRDVSSPCCQVHKRITVERLDRFDDKKGEWKEVLVEDRHAGPAETAAARIDVADWFASPPRRKRRIAKTLATGETTKRAARKFRVSRGRISQTRRELAAAWREFQGEAACTPRAV
jgi:hypothetical protein